MELRPATSPVQPQAPVIMREPAPAAQPARAPAAAAPAAKTSEVQAKAEAPGKEELSKALDSINKTLQDRAPGLEFSVDRESDRTIVKVVDMETKEVIRQMPSREAMEIAKALDKLQSLMARQTA
ncbi:MAG TPA: flagellar protein FlaG [Telluria sp.]